MPYRLPAADDIVSYKKGDLYSLISFLLFV